ncbi:MAG: proline--tRNA ligase [Tissierellia bacterium]|nr:proline--tRNA ligase [Tissierellia bacterium]
MRLKSSYFYTLREDVKGEESVSGNLLVRAGMIKKTSGGVYMMLPLGLRVINKIEQIIREEMVAAGSQEVSMPALIPEEVYVESGRRESFGKSMFSLRDRYDRPFVLGPTHEELFAAAAAMKINSYKDMPFNLFQFQKKFRDEPRPRFGLIRVREFTMKDAYSFDRDLEGLDISYNKMFEAYKRSFDRMGIRYAIVTADTGVMGGLLSEEFQALTEIGEDILVLEPKSGYAANIEVAGCLTLEEASSQEHLVEEKVHTPGAATIEEVAAFFHEKTDKFIKTLIYSLDGKPHALLVRGDHEVNEVKIQKLLDVSEIEMASPEVVLEVTGAEVGYAGPLGLEIPVIVDKEVELLANFIVGANEKDYHYKNVNLEDFRIDQVADIRLIKEGDLCENGQGPVVFTRGIEIGNTFKLGDKYSKAMDLYYSDEKNHLIPVMMGSYGIGSGRCMAAIVEQNHNEHGILWPKELAPIQVAVVVVNIKKQEQAQAGEALYGELLKTGLDVCIDDRDERIGVKFNDMELIGVYARITVGRDIDRGLVELKLSDEKEKRLVSIEEILPMIKTIFSGEKAHD